jgi:hypothetical protein
MVLGLPSPVERMNCWWLAEQTGHHGPQAMQRLPRTAVCAADAVRDDPRGFATAQPGDPAGRRDRLTLSADGRAAQETRTFGPAGPVAKTLGASTDIPQTHDREH